MWLKDNIWIIKMLGLVYYLYVCGILRDLLYNKICGLELGG